MSLQNKVTLIGRTGKEVKYTTFEKGQRASVSLATSSYYTDSKGERLQYTQWHNLVAFGKLAEILKLAKKGHGLAIEGKILNRSYLDDAGNTKYISEVRVESVLLLTPVSKSEK